MGGLPETMTMLQGRSTMFFSDEGFDYQEPCIRPPSEACSILLQATLGCSHNKCTFCETFKKKRFAIKDRAILEKDLAFAEKYCPNQKRLFVMDGDALVMPMKHWEWLLANIAERLPNVERVSTYANAKGVALKSDEELRRLRKLGLSMIYYGVESGHPDVLLDVRKGSTPEKLVEQGKRLKDAGFVLSITVMVGIAGVKESLAHAKKTGEVLSLIDPEYVGALTLLLSPGTPLEERARRGEFVMPDTAGLLRETGAMIEHTTLTDGLFMANHPSNYLSIRAHLPYDKEVTLKRVRAALSGDIQLREEWRRAF
jgi:radical SAM superfamily enzyme YgiQ (UPF0313 family)